MMQQKVKTTRAPRLRLDKNRRLTPMQIYCWATVACLAVLPAALGLDGVWLTAPAAGVLTAALAVWFLIAVLRQERAQDRQEGEGTPQA